MKLSKHDYYTYNHSVNVSVYSIALCKKVYGDDRKLLIQAGMGGLLHDLGKRAVPTAIINKPGKLDAAEWEEIKKHPEHGYTLLQKVATIPEESKRIVYEHHENIDGSGYPRKLCDTQISKLSKIATIADVFDALTTNRSYKKGLPPQEALQVMFGMAPGKFEPTIFNCFDKSIENKTRLTLEPQVDPCDPRGIAIKKTG